MDNTAGSGTTAIACLNTNRQFIVMEKEQEYYDIILKKRVGDFNKKFETQTLWKRNVVLAYNGKVLCAVGDFESETLKLLLSLEIEIQMLKIMDKVELKDETAILPSPCYVQCGDNLELLKSQTR